MTRICSDHFFITAGSISPVISARSPPWRMPPSASIAGLQIFFVIPSMASRSFSVIANPIEYCTLRPRTLPCSVSQSSSPCDAPAPSERISSLRRWVAGICAIRVGEDLDVVGGGVRAGVPGAQLAGEELLRVVAPHPDRMVAEGPLERRSRVLLLAERDHDRGVEIEHDDLAELDPRDPARRDAGTPSDSCDQTWRRTRAGRERS